MGSTWSNKYSTLYISERAESHREEKIKFLKPTQYAVIRELALDSGKEGGEMGEKTQA